MTNATQDFNFRSIVLPAIALLFTLAQRNKVGAADLDRTHVSPEREAQIAAKQPAPAAA